MSAKAERALDFRDLAAIGVNAIVGSGIFFFPGRAAGLLGPASVLSFGVVGILLIFVGLCFAEASTYFDKSGGPYLYARAAFGTRAGFAIGWLSWIAQMFSWAAVANVISLYLGFVYPAFALPRVAKLTAAAAIVLSGALNYRGVKLGAEATDFFTAAKLLPLILFVLVGLPRVKSAYLAPFAPHGWRPLGPACFLVYFAFQGFEFVPVPSGEVKNPARTIPCALIASLVFATLLYMAIQATAVGLDAGLAASQRPLADAAIIALGAAGALTMSLGAVFSTVGYNAGSALVTPRYLVALAEGGEFPEGLAAIHPRFGTPHLCVLATTFVTLAMALSLDFNKLVDFTNVVICSQYLAACASIPFLRKLLKPLNPDSFRLPGGLIIPLIGCAAVLWLGSQSQIGQIGWACAILALGFLIKSLSSLLPIQAPGLSGPNA